MMHKAWSSIEEVPYCFSRSYIKSLKIVVFDPNWAFPDCNSSLNSPMNSKLETAKERCPIVFQGHPSNFKVTRDKTSPILTQIGRFRTIGRSQLSNPSDLPCCSMMWTSGKTSGLSINIFNSLAPEKLELNFRYVICKRISMIDGWGIFCEIALIWMSLDFTDDQSTLDQVMAWCRQATSHYLSQCWPRSLSPYGVTRSVGHNELIPFIL